MTKALWSEEMPSPLCYIPHQDVGDHIRKLLECAARKHDQTIRVTTPRGNGGRNTSTRNDKPSWSTIVLRKGANSPKDTLKLLQQKVNPQDHSVEVKRIQEIGNGEILIKVAEKKQGGATTFMEALSSEGVAQAQAAPTASRKIAIRNLPKDTTREVEINWKSAPVTRWVDVPCCQKCKKVCHRARGCTSDRIVTTRCHKCGEAGHTVKSCGNVARCYNCGTAEHAANSAACPIFRRFLRHSEEAPQRFERQAQVTPLKASEESEAEMEQDEAEEFTTGMTAKDRRRAKRRMSALPEKSIAKARRTNDGDQD